MPTLTQAEYRSLKSKLTRAKNSKDPQKLLDTAVSALERFDEVGYPDDWNRWSIAAEDARYALAKQRGSW